MIEGIEILAQSEVMVAHNWVMLVLIIFAASFIAWLISIGMNVDWLFIYSSIPFVLSIIALLLVVILDPKVPTGKYEYQVTMDENVSFIEFYERYEVVDQEGKIWTIRDKELNTEQ